MTGVLWFNEHSLKMKGGLVGATVTWFLYYINAFSDEESYKTPLTRFKGL